MKVFKMLLALIATITGLHCSSEAISSCKTIHLSNSQYDIYILPISITDILQNESPRNQEQRKEELQEHLHFKVRLISKDTLSEEEKSTYNFSLHEMVSVFQENQKLIPSLHISEPVLSSYNTMQFLFAYEKANNANVTLQVFLNVGENPATDNMFLIPQACFE